MYDTWWGHIDLTVVDCSYCLVSLSVCTVVTEENDLKNSYGMYLKYKLSRLYIH